MAGKVQGLVHTLYVNVWHSVIGHYHRRERWSLQETIEIKLNFQIHVGIDRNGILKGSLVYNCIYRFSAGTPFPGAVKSGLQRNAIAFSCTYRLLALIGFTAPLLRHGPRQIDMNSFRWVATRSCTTRPTQWALFPNKLLTSRLVHCKRKRLRLANE